MGNKTAVMEKYLFHLAFENSIVDDYVTEKLWGSLEAGTLPIYYGAPNIRDLVPSNSIVVVDEFDSIQDLADHLVELSYNETLYNSYHEWRKHPLEEKFLHKFNFTRTHSRCRFCKLGYAKLYGFGWDAAMQEVRELKIPRTVCRGSDGLIERPFREGWLLEWSSGSKRSSRGEPLDVSSLDSTTQSCQIDDGNRWIDIGLGLHGRLRRGMYPHDGVVDIVVEYVPDDSWLSRFAGVIVGDDGRRERTGTSY